MVPSVHIPLEWHSGVREATPTVSCTWADPHMCCAFSQCHDIWDLICTNTSQIRYIKVSTWPDLNSSCIQSSTFGHAHDISGFRQESSENCTFFENWNSNYNILDINWGLLCHCPLQIWRGIFLFRFTNLIIKSNPKHWNKSHLPISQMCGKIQIFIMVFL